MRMVKTFSAIPRSGNTRMIKRALELLRHPRYAISLLKTPPALADPFEQESLRRFYEAEILALNREDRERLVGRFKSNVAQIPAATAWIYHLELARQILTIPASVAGAVVECGCWKGASTANLSLACEIAGRELIVCDSFEGLPEDDAVTHDYPHLKVFGHYEAGMYVGRLEEVKENITRYGSIDVCRFVKGFFSDTLPDLSEPIALAFLDVDLVSSLRDCIKYLWPLLNEGGLIYTDDSCDMETVRPWFDDEWWQRELGVRSPGYVGSGCGLPMSHQHTSLGYARKISDPSMSYGRVSWLRYETADRKAPQTS